MRTVAVVPIKMNNQRLPKKNIKKFKNGKPLCYYVLSTLLSINEIDEVYVYCSDRSICEYLPEGVIFLQRSKGLDSDTTKINEIIKSFAKDVRADIYMIAHTTAPFISQQSIIKGINAVKSGKYDSAFAAKKIQDFMWKDGEPLNYELDNVPRTQDLPVIYQETSGFYVFTRDVIIEFNRRIGNKPLIVEVGEIEGIDIDEMEDFIIADAVFNYSIEYDDSRVV